MSSIEMCYNSPQSFSQIPLSRHRQNRRCTFFQFPYVSGKSRQGAPVRKIQNTPLINCRVSRALPPRVPFSPIVFALILPFRKIKKRGNPLAKRASAFGNLSLFTVFGAGFLEHNYTIPSLEFVMQACSLLGVTPDYFLLGINRIGDDEDRFSL